MRVVFVPHPDILNPWFDDFVDALGGAAEVHLYDPGAAFRGQVAGADVVVEIGGSIGTREMIDEAAAAGVRLWQILGTGVDHVDVEHFLERRLPVANTPGTYSAVALAEHALHLMLCFAKNFRAADAAVRRGRFYEPLSDELAGRTLGIVGLGASGKALAVRAAAFDMSVVAIDPVPVPPRELTTLSVSSCLGPDELGAVLAQSDYVSLHLPLTPDTRHLIDRDALSRMPVGSLLINVSRGALVDEAALVEALRAGRIRGAGIDTPCEEPLPLDHPFLALESVIVTPHIAGMTAGTSRRRAEVAAENVRRVMAGERALHVLTQGDPPHSPAGRRPNSPDESPLR